MLTTPRIAASLTAAATAATIAFPAGAVAHASKLKLGVYDCEAYNIAYNMLSYRASVKLMSRHRYQGSTGRHGAKLVKPSHGTYKVSGTKLHFKGGSYRKAVGHITKSGSGGAPHIALYYKGKSSGISCYYVAHP